MKNSKQKPLIKRRKKRIRNPDPSVKTELTLGTVESPEEPPEIDASTLVALRKRAGMSQAIFARMLNISAETMRSWERGSRLPSDACRRLIHVFSEQPSMMCRVVGLPEVQLKGVRIEKTEEGTRRIIILPLRPRQSAKRPLPRKRK